MVDMNGTLKICAFSIFYMETQPLFINSVKANHLPIYLIVKRENEAILSNAVY